MVIDKILFNKPVPISSVSLEIENGQTIDLDILRLDKIHTQISGNKWYKLKYNILRAQELNAHSILSFGGAYSNHLHALAYAGKLGTFPTIGVVRGEEMSNPTLKDCKAWGMQLHFVSRAAYRTKTNKDFLNQLQDQFPNTYIIPEGGDNLLGQKGCTEILTKEQIATYDMLCCSIGTGTTISGLGKRFRKEIWGFSSLKNAQELRNNLCAENSSLRYIDDYHFGGFGKFPKELSEYSERFKEQHKVELDRVYTAKMFYGIEQELLKNVDARNKKILLVHTGGLQGNRSGQIQ